MRPVILCVLTAILADSKVNFEAEITSWRREREARLKAEDGWLSLAGLFWLKEGPNRVGSAADAQVKLPPGAPANAGTVTLHRGKIRFEKKELRPDTADFVSIAGVKLFAIHRGQRYAIRMKDNNSEARKNFKGLRWFPPRQEWVLRARFEAFDRPRKMYFDSQTGDTQEMISPGYVHFTYGGRALRLTPVEEDNRLFFVFRDRTAGRTTYAACRFLYAEKPSGGVVILDFNKAYNPPCVFTPYATCPLPPTENRLPIAVEAGEMMYKGHR